MSETGIEIEGARIAITGGTGFVGRALIQQLAARKASLRCWHRPSSDLSSFEQQADQIEWLPGDLASPDIDDQANQLVEGCDAIVHSAYWRPGTSFRDTGGDLVEYSRVNILGTLALIQAAMAANVKRFIFVSTCAVHEQILDDRALDESHPLWALTHYGAHKAAIEKFVHSYGLGHGYPICAVRPTGIYGVMHDAAKSKWFDLVTDVAAVWK